MHGDVDEDGNDEDRNVNMVTIMTMARVAITMATIERTMTMEKKMIMMKTWKWQTGLSSPVTVLVSLVVVVRLVRKIVMGFVFEQRPMKKIKKDDPVIESSLEVLKFVP